MRAKDDRCIALEDEEGDVVAVEGAREEERSYAGAGYEDWLLRHGGWWFSCLRRVEESRCDFIFTIGEVAMVLYVGEPAAVAMSQSNARRDMVGRRDSGLALLSSEHTTTTNVLLTDAYCSTLHINSRLSFTNVFPLLIRSRDVRFRDATWTAEHPSIMRVI